MDTPFPNQPPPYEGRNLYLTDVALRDAVVREGAPWADGALMQWGATLGAPETYALADAANRNGPQLRTLDRRGERIDSVEFHPAWDTLMRLATAAGLHCAPWAAPGPGAQVARAAMYFLHAQVENGTQCPLTMTYASVPVLARHAATLPGGDRWLACVLARDYDPRPLPIDAKRAALIGMGMTERQGGSDVRANLTRAEPAGDGAWRVTGHKWFFSAPQCDAHLVLAQADAGITCFLLPHFLPDGARNAVRINRLKDKLGNRSNASAEVEFAGALAYPLGAPGRGIPTILEMVQHTRLDCVIGSAGMMRAALAWALHHAVHRVAFGHVLVKQPLMAAVLADLALEVEGATALALRLARAFDAPPNSAERALARVATPAAKYWICKRAPMVALEAMEVLGGNGYVEETPVPRVYREAPVNSIWEGSANVICLDVLRAVEREPTAVEALAAELALARGGNADLDRATRSLLDALTAPTRDAAGARRIAQGIALSLAAATLVRNAAAPVA
ncbi:MAG TPA: isovaleryl-CoA dehydrogenase, partial [Casimicrobiaceae bacterium]|nr:isovaleryl-CoA dehydrogenase [Casimicrobiaceae bacterium]